MAWTTGVTAMSRLGDWQRAKSLLERVPKEPRAQAAAMAACLKAGAWRSALACVDPETADSVVWRLARRAQRAG